MTRLARQASGGAGDSWPTAEQTLLLRAALLDGDAARIALEKWRVQVDPDRLDRLDRGSSRLLPLLYERLRTDAPDPLLSRLEQAYERTVSENGALLDATAGVIRALDAAGIDSVLLKGMALVARDVVPAGARPMDDSDLLVPEPKALAARDALVRHGWRLLEPMDADLLSVRHAVTFAGPHGHRLDLHWHVLADCCDSEADADFWLAAEPASIRGVATRTLCATDMLLHTCVHGIRWSVVPPVRWAADAVSIIRRAGPIDWERLVDQAERRELVLPMIDTLRYLHDALDVAVPSRVHARLSGIRVSRRAAAEYRIRMRRRSPLRQFLFHWLQHRRLRTGSTLLGDLVRFPAYAQRRWDLLRRRPR